MIYNAEQYLKAPPISLPYKSESGLVIEELTVQCKNCGQPAQHLRGHIVEHPNCTEIRFAGICHPCKLITSTHMRQYNNGRMIANTDNGWVEVKTVQNWYERLVDKIMGEQTT